MCVVGGYVWGWACFQGVRDDGRGEQVKEEHSHHFCGLSSFNIIVKLFSVNTTLPKLENLLDLLLKDKEQLNSSCSLI